tara:strand:- start:351 stop:491 length:141 start_codon:yes stop_codon:yes gene_type:complete
MNAKTLHMRVELGLEFTAIAYTEGVVFHNIINEVDDIGLIMPFIDL